MLQIDMLEEPADEDDLIFLAHNEFVGGRYVFVIKNGGIEQLKSAVASIGSMFSEVGRAFSAAIKRGGGFV